MECAGGDAPEECRPAAVPVEPVPSPLQADDDKIVSQMYSINDELVSYAFRLLDQCITLTDAVAEINKVLFIDTSAYNLMIFVQNFCQ